MSTTVHHGILALLGTRPGAMPPNYSADSNTPDTTPQVIRPGNAVLPSMPPGRADTDRVGALPIAMENIRASGTEIQEADLAVRVAGQARGQVLANVSRSVLALANPQRQNLLDLLM